MIDINKLTEKDIGRWVKYEPGYCKSDGTKFYELGKIKSWNDMYIFVVYKCAEDWKNFKDYTAASTEPKYLTFEIF